MQDVRHGIPATLGGVDEGYPLAITLIGRDGRRVDVEIDEFPDGDPRGRAQRQARTRDRRLMGLGWTVVRVPAWRAYLDPGEVADQVLAAAFIDVPSIDGKQALLDRRPHPQVKIAGRRGKLPGTYQGRRGPRLLRGAVTA